MARRTVARSPKLPIAVSRTHQKTRGYYETQESVELPADESLLGSVALYGSVSELTELSLGVSAWSVQADLQQYSLHNGSVLTSAVQATVKEAYRPQVKAGLV